MTETELNLLDALVELEDSIEESALSGTMPNLLPLFERIETLTHQLPEQTDPSLIHYLDKKSYQKARVFLQDKESRNQAGSCGSTT